MGEIIFALDPQMPQSYTDLLNMIAFNGYKTVTFGDIDPQADNCYIMPISNGNNAAGWQNPKARIILWDMEWRPDEYPYIPGCEYWHMDKATADKYGVKYVPVGGDWRLGRRMLFQEEKRQAYDVAYYGYIVGVHRRELIANQLRNASISTTPVGLWDVDDSGQVTNARNAALSHSKVYLHVHQRDDSPGVPGLRMVVAAAYKLPVVMEVCANDGIFTGYMVESDHGRIVQTVRAALQDHETMRELGDALYDLLCVHYSFKRAVEAAV